MEVRQRDVGPQEPLSTPEPALHIALMGIDGAGKSTLAAEVAASLRATGRQVEIVNFKRAMAAADPATSGILGHVAFAALKAQYAEASPVDATGVLEELLALEGVSSRFAEVETRLRAVPVGRNTARPLLSSAVLEIVGGFWVHTYVESLLRAGVIVVNDSFGFKHVLKNALLAQRLSVPGSPTHRTARLVLETARSLFHTLFAPTHGYWIDTDPRLALRWRDAAGEEATPFESYGLAGDNGPDSFLAMQEDCRPAFRRAAEDWGWRRVDLADLPREENISRAVRLIEEDTVRRTADTPPVR